MLQGSQCPLPQLSLWPAPPSAPPQAEVSGASLQTRFVVSPTSPGVPFPLATSPLVPLSPLTVGLCFLKKSSYCHFMGFVSGVGYSRMPGPCGAPRKLKASFMLFIVDRKRTFKMRLVKLPSKPDVPGTVHGCAGTRDVYLLRFLPYSESLADLHEPEYPPRTRGRQNKQRAEDCSPPPLVSSGSELRAEPHSAPLRTEPRAAPLKLKQSVQRGKSSLQSTPCPMC